MKLKDNFETRVLLIFIHFSVILLIHKKNNKTKFSQEIFDNIFQNIEYNFREMGIGDVGVNKRMKTLSRIFYDILLKLNKSSNSDFTVNRDLLIKYFFKKNNINLDLQLKFGVYIANFYKFCLEISYKDIIRGQINYK